MKSRFCVCILGLLLCATQLFAELNITCGTSSGFPIVGTGRQAVLVVDDADADVVRTAAQCVVGDIESVTGRRLTLKSSLAAGDLPIMAGTLGSSPLLDALVATGRVDTTGVTGVWEAYALQLVDAPMEGVEQALVVMGGTPRGTAYGLLEISRRVGVSPYVWWADVAPMPQETICVTGTRSETERPDVKYRGLFINDEDWALLPWAKKTFEKSLGNIGPRTYERVMELLLRLRGNCLWPAKHGSSRAFWSLAENKQLARKWAIVMSSGDSMLRDNLWEWPRFTNGGGSSTFSFANNPEQVADYWAKRAGEARGYEGIFDIGMRGLQDVALIGYEGQAAQLQGLADIIACQRQILTDSLGDATRVPQIYIPYKEALTLYNAGLQIPDDVTLCWVDDNYAYIRQLPTAAEQRRSGGNGIYYHLSYLGNPCSYIWLSTISPSLVSYELCKAYENGMRRFWMFNVGDIKPAEAEFEFCMELAWDVSSWTPERAWEFSRWWAEKTFGEDLADEMASLRLEHYRLAAAGKPETLLNIDYTVEQMERRLTDYAALAARVAALEGAVPTRLQDAYFQLFTYPMRATAAMNAKLLGARLSWLYAGVGDYDRTMHYAAMAREGHAEIVRLTDYYNNTLSGGKWSSMMSRKPYGGSQFDLPQAATVAYINAERGELTGTTECRVAADSYTGSRGNWKQMQNLGVEGHSVGVWPIDYTTYSGSAARLKAPYVEYDVPLEAGTWRIMVRCLPTFPLTTAHDLQVGISMNNGTITSQSIKCSAETNRWSDNVMYGYTEAQFEYKAATARTYKLRVFALTPALVVSEVAWRQTDPTEADQETDDLLVNPDFELYLKDGNVTENTGAATQRGVPYGWTLKGTMTGNSYGISHSETSITHDSGNTCWFKAKPMPSDFELSQTVPAEKLQAGIYEVTCLLWNETGKRGSCRMFANDHVQYFGRWEDYNNILREDEVSTFAGHKAGYSTHAILQPMRVTLAVRDGESLRVGIRTSNQSNDEAKTDESGWFLVDHFRVRRLGDLPKGDADSLTNELLVNPDFEYIAADKKNPAGKTTLGVPYGWQMTCGSNNTFPGSTYGIYPGGNGAHGSNYCAFTTSGALTMPNDFCLSQTISAARLGAGTYRISCLFWSESGLEGQGRLFANREVQYFANSAVYEKNQTEGEHATFASYIAEAVDANTMQEMCVYVTLSEGEDLTLGVRSGSLKGNGTQATGTDRTGKFRVDHFRIQRVEGDVPTNIIEVAAQKPAMQKPTDGVYDLSGRRVADSDAQLRALPKGIYIVGGKKRFVNF